MYGDDTGNTQIPREINSYSIVLYVLKKNVPAIRCYTQAGFRIVQNYNPDKTVDYHMMVYEKENKEMIGRKMSQKKVKKETNAKKNTKRTTRRRINAIWRKI